MDSSQRSQGQLIAAAGGVLLFIFLFLPWFGLGRQELSGWQGQSSTDIYLLITAVIAVGTAITARGRVALPGTTMNGATTLLGGVGTILLLWLVVFDFPAAADREVGLYLSLIAVIMIAVGGYLATQDEARKATRDRR